MMRLLFALWTLCVLLSPQVLPAGTEAYQFERLLAQENKPVERNVSPLSSLVSSCRGHLIFLDLSHKQLLLFDKGEIKSRTVPLPTRMKTNAGGLWTLLGAPNGDIWVVDHEDQQIWKYSQRQWSVPRPTGKELGPAIMLSDGRIVASTPESPTAAFEILDPTNPETLKKFGRRVPPVHPLLDREENTWVLGSTEDHHLFAVHAYRPLVRIYTIDPLALVMEKKLEGPDISLLENMRKNAIKEAFEAMKTGCSTCLKIDLVNFADHLISVGQAMLVHLAGRNQAEILDTAGVRGDSVLLDLQLPVETTPGFCIHGRRLAAVESRGLVLLRAMENVPEMEGFVLSESGAPVDGATVSFSGVNQISYRTKSEPNGEFHLRGIHLDHKGQLRVEAGGYFPLERSGERSVLSAEPVVLKAVPRICLAVSNERGDPITTFTIAVFRSENTSTGINHTPGPTLDINDPDGIGCVNSPWTKDFSVEVDADGYAIHEEKFVRAEDREIRLKPEGRLQLTVLEEESGEPVSGAFIMLTAESDGRASVSSSVPGGVATSDQQGLAKLVGLHAATLVLSVSHQDFLSFEKKIEIEEGDNIEKVFLQRGSTIHCVTKGRQGNAIEGASVQLQGIGRALSRTMVCTTAADGACEIRAVPPGSYKAVASKAGVGSSRGRVSVKSGQKKVEVILNLSGDHVLIGRVTGMEKYPGMSFKAFVDVAGQARTAPVSSDGDFRIDGLRAGDAWIWIREAESRSSYGFKDVEIAEEDEQSEVEIDLEDPLEIEGTVWVGQRVCVGCELAFGSQGASVTPFSKTVRTDFDGAYQLRLPCRGAFSVVASDPETGALSRDHVELRESRELDFHLGQGVIRGTTILRDTGDSLDGVLVQISREGQTVAEIRSQGGGAFQFDGLPPGSYTLVGNSEKGSGHREVDLTGDERVDTVLELESQGRIQLRLHDAAGSPVGLSYFRLRSAEGRVAVVPAVLADQDQIFSLQVLSDSPHELTVAAPGLARIVLRDISPGPPLDVSIPFSASLRVELQDLEGCFLEVRDASGSPLALNLQSEPGPVPIQSAGAVLTALPPGPVTVFLTGCDGKIRSNSVQLVADKTAVVVFQEE